MHNYLIYIQEGWDLGNDWYTEGSSHVVCIHITPSINKRKKNQGKEQSSKLHIYEITLSLPN